MPLVFKGNFNEMQVDYKCLRKRHGAMKPSRRVLWVLCRSSPLVGTVNLTWLVVSNFAWCNGGSKGGVKISYSVS